MIVIKRDGTERKFESEKIENAIKKANATVDDASQLDEKALKKVVSNILKRINKFNRPIEVEEIQDIVEVEIMNGGFFQVAQNYSHYRSEQNFKRSDNNIKNSVISLVSGKNESLKEENANKDVRVVGTQRDYIAGIVSKELFSDMLNEVYNKLSDKGKEIITDKKDIPSIVEAHNKGIVHFHDMDYFIQPMHNCDLINLKDMLTNGTVINGVQIDKPRSLRTAATLATQISLSVSSSQYGLNL